MLDIAHDQKASCHHLQSILTEFPGKKRNLTVLKIERITYHIKSCFLKNLQEGGHYKD